MTVQYRVNQILASMTLRQKVSGLLILHVAGTDSVAIRHFLETYQPAGLIFMDDNIPTTDKQLKELIRTIQQDIPFFFTIDEEGGPVKRLTSDTFYAANQLMTLPASATADAFRERSKLLYGLGLNVNLGIVADMSNDSSAFIYSRTFGGDPVIVSERVSAAVKASHEGTLSVLKHFPGHGATTGDSHTDLPIVNISKEVWKEQLAEPFVAGIDSGAHMVMFGHLIFSSVDELPSSLSSTWHTLARDELCFDGLMITDDMVMLAVSEDPRYQDHVANAVAALRAGNNLLLFVTDYGWPESRFDVHKLIEGIVVAVESGELDEEVINTSLQHVLTVKQSLVAHGV